VGLPQPTRDLLAAVLMAATADRPLPGRPSPPENWHLTLRYLGDTDEVVKDRLLAGLDQAELGPPFSVELSGLGAFPNPRRATVLWAGVSRGGDRLAELASIIDEEAEAVGFVPEDRPYVPHLTLSRLRPDEDLTSLIDGLVLPPIRFEVSSVGLYRSHLAGSTWYELMDEFTLT
jgi:RNA 2',3'-cyclic 3'-phosphodiesterase